MKKVGHYLSILICASHVFTMFAQNDYQQEVRKWHEGRVDRLKQPIGWLSLAGLDWLEEKKTVHFGSSENQSLRFPEDAPALIGTGTLTADSIIITIAEGVEVRYEEQSIKEVSIARSDIIESGMFSCGRYHWHLLERGGKVGFRIWDTENPILQSFDTIPYYPIDARWKVAAQFVPADSSESVTLDNVLGMKITIQPTGYVRFKLNGQEYQLRTLPGDDSTYFVIFSDETNGLETYGGGRYIYIPHEDEKGVTHIDFNKSYNPPCLFTDYATCLLPTRDDHLPIEVTAGEKADHH